MNVKPPPIQAWPRLPDKLAVLLGAIESEGGISPRRHSRPWDLATLPDDLAVPVWAWLHEVVSWLNENHAWQPETVIPPCWPQHPHLTLEVAALAFVRQAAIRSIQPSDLHEWHADLAEFHTRMRDAIGENGLKDCQRGKHSERPSTYELSFYLDNK